MKSNEGYINVVSVMQKYFDQAISGNWSYNPEDYEENQVPLSVMAQDLLTTYKLGWKTSYYQNTYDFKGEDVEELREEISTPLEQEAPHPEPSSKKELDEECEACAI